MTHYLFNGPESITSPEGDEVLADPHVTIRQRRQGEDATSKLSKRQQLEIDHPQQEYNAVEVAMSAVDSLRGKQFRINDIPVPPSHGEHRAADSHTPRVIE